VDLAKNFDHVDLVQAADPHALYRQLRANCPIAWSEQQEGFWVVTGYDEAIAVTQDPGTFSSCSVTVPRHPPFAFPTLPPTTIDPPRHREFRKLIQPLFSPANSRRLEEVVSERCTYLLDSFVADGRCDGSTEYALRIPVTVIVSLMGVPLEDEPLFTHWVHVIVDTWDDMDRAAASAMEMVGYINELIVQRRGEPRDDVVSLLLAAQDAGEITQEEVYGTLFVFLTAGIDTAWKVIGNSLRHLAVNPEDRKRLVADPSLVSVATEEFLRFYAPASMGRVVTRDVEMAGAAMHAEDSMLVCYPAANRDERVFENAEEFVLDRGSHRHLAFGSGIHRCIGAAFGRMEVEMALSAWLARIPDFALDPESDVVMSQGQIWGPTSVPLVWG
jgi:cytochrome P450